MAADADHPAAARAGFAVVKDEMHPFGDPNQVTIHEGSQVPVEAAAPGTWMVAVNPRMVVSIALTLIGSIVLALTALAVSLILFGAVVGLLCLSIGIALGVPDRPSTPGSSEEG